MGYALSAEQQKRFVLKPWPIVGHERIITALRNFIQRDKIPHAFLFLGPENLGKATVALYFMKSIQCQEKIRPCGKCVSCLQIVQNLHPDTFLLQKKERIGIEEIRKLIKKLTLRPFISKYKICLINNANYLTREATNALLKTLEEPKGQTIIILISSEERLPSTLISRCIIYKFLSVSLTKIINFLGSITPKAEKNFLKQAALQSYGRPGLAVRYVKEPIKVKEKQQIISDLKKIIQDETSDFSKLNFVSSLPKNKRELKNILNIWSEWYRNLILAKLNHYKLISDVLEREDLIKLSKRFSFNYIKNSISKINNTQTLLSQDINIKLLLENLVLDL